MHITTEKYNGTPIQFTDNMMNLTNMWKAAGGVQQQKPAEWLRHDNVVQFIETVRNKLKGGSGPLLKSTKGRYGGTYGHWQIALAYAKYLSPEFHIWCNEVVRDRFIAEQAVPENGLNHSN